MIEIRKPNGQLKTAVDFTQEEIESLPPARREAFLIFVAAQKDFAETVQACRDATDAVVLAEKTRNEFDQTFSKKFKRTFHEEWLQHRSHANLPNS
jgi:hypothetical protein